MANSDKSSSKTVHGAERLVSSVVDEGQVQTSYVPSTASIAIVVVVV